jgi:hypothetical protein
MTKVRFNKHAHQILWWGKPIRDAQNRGSILFPQPTSICPRFVQSHVNDIRTQADFVTVETKKKRIPYGHGLNNNPYTKFSSGI